MNNYSLLCMRSHYSLLQSVIQPVHLVDHLNRLGLKSCAITDFNTISGCVNFTKTLKDAGIKPILGCEFNICGDINNASDSKTSGLTLLAKNRKGWDSLIKLVSVSNRQENFRGKPRLDLELLSEFISVGNIIAYVGQSNSLLQEANSEYGEKGAINLANKLADLFGKDNFYLMADSTPNGEANLVRNISNRTGVSLFGNPNPHYYEQKDAELQRIVLCNELGTNLKRGHNSPFFQNDSYYIRSYDDLLKSFSKEEISQSGEIEEKIESFDIGNRPLFPHYECPNNLSPEDYLRQLCREGWTAKIASRVPKERHAEYAERIKYELDTFTKVGLSSYFLVLRDILDYVRADGSIIGVRGSANNCMTSYLANLSQLDPITYNLPFARFYNAARNTATNISLADIDADIPKTRREDTINYIKDKYGKDKVGQIISFQTIKGRGALKMVFRAYDNVSPTEQNEITEHIVDEAKISDELEEMKQDGEEPSIIRWALENRSSKLKNWVKEEDDGSLSGPLAHYFAHAIKLEKTKTTKSKHAGGIVVCSVPLEDVVPMIWDEKTQSQITGYEMTDLEPTGIVKMDLLGITTLNRLMTLRDILANGEITL